MSGRPLNEESNHPNSELAESIMREERKRTLAQIAKLPLQEQARDDVVRACVAIQRAINDLVAGLNRPVDQRVGPTAMYLMGDEIKRINQRFVEAGLAARLQ